MGKKEVIAGTVLAVRDELKPGMPLYPAEDGTPILTNSMLTSARRCWKQTEYKYVHRLKPKRLGGPLKRGKWVHSLLEEDAKGGDWKALHKKLSAKFEGMFDEEKVFYGDMPVEIDRIMRSYFWHYKRDTWEYVEVELELTARLPNGTLLRIKFDGLIRDQWGKLWLVDHKTHKTLPNLAYRTLDTQSPIYVWVARQNGYEVEGFIWNYLRWKAPSVPNLLKDGTRLSKSACDTDYPTLKKAIKDYGLDPADYQDWLDRLKAQRYEFGGMQTSGFFRRDIFERDPDVIDRMLLSAMRTADSMNGYDFTEPDAVERTVGRHCQYMCSYTDLCTAELMGHNTKPLLKQNYKVGDPMSYYHDRVGEDEERGE